MTAVVISFEGFLIGAGSPIYQQILLFIKRGAVAGTISDGDELPSRRVLSAFLGVNPNTIQKAYRMLEEEGLLEELKEKVCIGQGYRGRTGKLGVGNCTMRFEHTLAGCPPTETQMAEFLRKYLPT